LVVQVKLIEGEKKYLYFELQDYYGNPVDLTGASSITFQLQRIGESTLRINDVCELYYTTEGICRYKLLTYLPPSPPKYKAEIELYETTGLVSKFEKIYIDVEAELPS